MQFEGGTLRINTMPPNPSKKWFACKSIQATFAAINAYVLYKIDPQIDARKHYFESMGKDDAMHSFMRLVLLHFSSEVRKELACRDGNKKCMKGIKQFVPFE